jgi:hypothetical protein
LPSPLRVAGPVARTATVVPPHDNQPRLNDPESATRDVIQIEQHPNQGCPLHYVPTDYESDFQHRIRNPHPYWPFEDRKAFNFAHWFITSGVPGTAIDELLKGHFPLDDLVKQSLGSNYTFRKKLDLMDDGRPWPAIMVKSSYKRHLEQQPSRTDRILLPKPNRGG